MSIRQLLDASPFSNKTIKDAILFFKFIEGKGVKLKEIIKLFEAEKEDIKKKMEDARNRYEENAIKCPDCGKTMILYPVNMIQGIANKRGYKSRWECPACVFEIYSLFSPDEELKRADKNI